MPNKIKDGLCFCFNPVMPNRTVCRECFNKKLYAKRNQIRINCEFCEREITKRGKNKYCLICYRKAIKLFPQYIHLILGENK